VNSDQLTTNSSLASDTRLLTVNCLLLTCLRLPTIRIWSPIW